MGEEEGGGEQEDLEEEKHWFKSSNPTWKGGEKRTVKDAKINNEESADGDGGETNDDGGVSDRWPSRHWPGSEPKQVTINERAVMTSLASHWKPHVSEGLQKEWRTCDRYLKSLASRRGDDFHYLPWASHVRGWDGQARTPFSLPLTFALQRIPSHVKVDLATRAGVSGRAVASERKRVFFFGGTRIQSWTEVKVVEASWTVNVQTPVCAGHLAPRCSGSNAALSQFKIATWSTQRLLVSVSRAQLHIRMMRHRKSLREGTVSDRWRAVMKQTRQF